MDNADLQVMNKDLKILIVTTDPNKSGGVANYYKILSGNFSGKVDYFIMGSRTDKDGVISDIKRLLKDYKNFRKKIIAHKYDIIVLNPTLDLKAVIRDGRFILLARKYSSARLIVFWRGFYLDFFDNYIKKSFRRIFSYVFFKADAHIVLGTIFKDRLLSIGYRSPVYCETTIVGESFITDDFKKIQKDRFTILFLARIEKDKGIYEAINTFNIVKEKYKNTNLVIAGNGFEMDQAKKYVADHHIEDIQFLGDVRGNEKFKAFEDSDVYLFPSYYEGMPNSVLEAMAMGLPVVTRNVGGLADFFKHEEMGYITDSYEPGDLATYIEKLYADIKLRERISKTNKQYAKENFSMPVVIKRLEKIFNDVHSTNKKAIEA